MAYYIWPMALVILSNVVYQICAKSIPAGANTFASLAVTYLVGGVCSVLLFFVTGRGENFFGELGRLNWTSYALGLAIIGLEAGTHYAYKAGWQISTFSVVQSAFLAIALLIVGALIYREALTWNKLVGIAICAVGLIFINLK